MKLFKKRPSKKPISLSGLDGVITFFGAHHALKGEKLLSEQDIKVKLIPGPREISPNCGTALRFDYTARADAEVLFNEKKVLFEQILFYPVRTEK